MMLAASQARDSNGGFVDRHGEMPNEHDGARLSIEIGQTTNPDGSITVLLARKLSSAWCRESHHDRLSALPLAQRAWILQETLMARRIAHFMDTELLWECVTSLKCECMQVDCSDTSESCKSHGLVRQFDFTNTPHRELPTSVYEQWRNLRSTYSERAITRETDRLPALSGLAKLYMARLYKSADDTGRYLAGFWKEDLLQSIIWRIQPGHYQRASPYRAPTWSPFSLEYVDTPRGVPFEFEFEHRYWKLGRTYATVVGGECVPAGKDPTGAVKQDSYILLSGVLARSSCRWAEGASWSNDSGRSILFGDNHIAVDWDVDPDLEQPRTLYSLLIGETAFGWGKVLPIALVLQRSEVDEAYERVGLLGLYSYGGKELMNIFDGAHETLVKII